MVTQRATSKCTCDVDAQRARATSRVYRWPRICDEALAMDTFKADIEEIRRRAMEKMGDGAVTAFYKADRDKVVEVLNEVLATETVCTLRYRNHYFMATGIDSSGVEAEFLEHANDEQMHADRVAKRITELG